MPMLDLVRPAAPTPPERLAEAAALQKRHGDREPAEILDLALGDLFQGRIALVSSFGAEAAVLLHLAAGIDRHLPVIFVDTGRHFPETLAYRDLVAGHLGLTDIRSVGPSVGEVRAHDPWLALAEQDGDACCGFRKVAPLAAARVAA
jgi:phosphoadenosine phosphosulfate reductase